MKSPSSPVKKEDRITEDPGQLIYVGGNKRTFRVEYKIGSGTYSDVYKVHRTTDPDQIRALKIERFDSVPEKDRRLTREQAVFDFIQGYDNDCIDKSHFPKMSICAKTSLYVFYVMQLLGPTLHDVRKTIMRCRTRPRTIAEIGRQTLAAIESLHGLGWLHRAIKPHNFHVGLKEVERMIFMVGFDLTRYYKDQGGRITSSHRLTRSKGATRYASARAMKYEDLSRRDDVESWCYMMLEFYERHNLMWACIDMSKGHAIAFKQHVMSNPIELRNKNHLRMPARFADIITMTFKLQIDDKPDYEGMSAIMEKIIKDERIDMTLPLDWIGRELPLRSSQRKEKREEVEESEADDNEPRDEKERQKKDLLERKRKLEEEMVEIYKQEGQAKTVEQVKEEMEAKNRELKRKMDDHLERSIVDRDDAFSESTTGFKERCRLRELQEKKKSRRKRESRERQMKTAEEKSNEERSVEMDERKERAYPQGQLRRKPARGRGESRMDKARKRTPEQGKKSPQTVKEVKPEVKPTPPPKEDKPEVKPTPSPTAKDAKPEPIPNVTPRMAMSRRGSTQTFKDKKDLSITDKLPLGDKPTPAAIARAFDRDEIGLKRLDDSLEAAKKAEIDAKKKVYEA